MSAAIEAECVNDSGCRAAGGRGGRGLSPLVGGSLARASSATGAPARAAAATRACPTTLRSQYPPLRTLGDRACKSSRAVLLAPGIVPPPKLAVKGATACGLRVPCYARADP
jgi:hypothetical protein